MIFFEQESNFVTIEGVIFEFSQERPTSPGETYIAERNGGPKLLTVDYIDHKNGIVFPKELAYPYNLNECRKVVRIL